MYNIFEQCKQNTSFKYCLSFARNSCSTHIFLLWKILKLFGLTIVRIGTGQIKLRGKLYTKFANAMQWNTRCRIAFATRTMTFQSNLKTLLLCDGLLLLLFVFFDPIHNFRYQFKSVF